MDFGVLSIAIYIKLPCKNYCHMHTYIVELFVCVCVCVWASALSLSHLLMRWFVYCEGGRVMGGRYGSGDVTRGKWGGGEQETPFPVENGEVWWLGVGVMEWEGVEGGRGGEE